MIRNSKGQFIKGVPTRTGIKHTSETIKKIKEARKRQGSNVWNKGKKYLKITGENHWNWRGGITSWRKQQWTSLEHKQWRKTIYERDNFTCKKCNVSGGYLEAHHINNFKDFPELRLAIDNGITLCKKCHRQFHNKYTEFNNTREQLKEFIYE